MIRSKDQFFTSNTVTGKNVNATEAMSAPAGSIDQLQSQAIQAAQASIPMLNGGAPITRGGSGGLGYDDIIEALGFVPSANGGGAANVTANSIIAALGYVPISNVESDAAYSNAVLFANTVANAAYTNATSYASSIAATAFANAVLFANTVANAAYTNAVSFATTAAGAAYTNAIAYSGNAVAAYSNAVLFANTVANAAYTNAVSFAATIAATAYSNAITYSGNAALAYANAVTYASTIAATAYSNATSFATTIAGTAYTNAIAYSGNAVAAYTNAAVFANTVANAAYTNAVSFATTIAATAYTNAVSFATTIAGTAYSNAVSYAATIAGTAYTNAVSFATTIAATAYSNAIAYSGNAALAYSNAVTYSSNASNLANGTVPNARLDADLGAIAAFSSTGYAVRTATDTWALRTIVGTSNELTVTNGDGVSANTTLSLPSALTFTGKTVTGGTFSGVTVSGGGTISGTFVGAPAFNLTSTSSGQQSLTVSSTDAGAVGATLKIYHDSASPAASDLLGRIIFNGRDSGGTDTTYARIQVDISDPTDTTETSVMGFQTIRAGAITTRLFIGNGVYHGSATGGDKGVNTLNIGTLYQNNVQVATLTGSETLSSKTISGAILSGTFSGSATISATTDFTGAVTISRAGLPLRLTNTTDGATNGGLIIESDRATPTLGDIINMSFYASNDAGTQVEFSRISSVVSNVTAAASAGYLMFAARASATLSNVMRMTTTVLSPHVSDGMALGSTSLMWGDLFLASGGVINFNSSDVTITHNTNLLAFAGASSGYTFDAGLLIQSAVPQITVQDSATAATTKYSLIRAGQYDSATETEGTAVIGTENNATNNVLIVGGGFAAHNAVTQIDFYTAANATTRTGTLRARITSAGVLEVGGNSVVTTANYTAADVLSKLLTVDGAGSTLDADLFDGLNSDAYGRLATSSTWTTKQTFTMSGGSDSLLINHNGTSSYGVALTVKTTAGTDDPKMAYECYNGGSPVYWATGTFKNGFGVPWAVWSGSNTGAAGSAILTVWSHGLVAATGNMQATDFVISSDVKLKTDIAPIENALSKLRKVRGVEYTRISTGEREMGVIAQEVQEAGLPLLVEEIHEVLNVRYPRLTAAIIEALKELADRVEKLEHAR